MAFDFDDLDEQLPAELPEVCTMSDDDFAKLGSRLRSAAKALSFNDFDKAVSEALWVAGSPEIRMQRIVEELLSLAKDAAKHGADNNDAQRTGSAAMNALFGLSVSMSQDSGPDSNRYQ